MTIVRKCDSHQGGGKGIRKVCQLMKRCDGHGGDVKLLGRCDSCQKVVQSPGRCKRCRKGMLIDGEV